MAPPPKTRQSHVYRVYATDSGGNVSDDNIWIDVARIDHLPMDMRGLPTGKQGQIVNYVLDWKDDLAASVPERDFAALTVKEPDQGPGAVALKIIKKTFIVSQGKEDGTEGQGVRYVFHSEPDSETPTGRKVKSIRVVNNDLKGEITMPPATVGQPPPSTPKGGRIDWDAYRQALQDGTTDASQFLDIEVTDTLKLSFEGAADGTRGQIVKFVLAGSKAIENLFAASPSDAADHGLIYRTDPLQTIVNVSWGGGGLAVEFFDKAT